MHVGSSWPSRVVEARPEREGPPGDAVIKLNVCGRCFQAKLNVFSRFPDTTLGDSTSRSLLWNEERKEYILDAHPLSFEAIFQFYQTGYLRRPYEVHFDTFVDELRRLKFSKQIIDAFTEICEPAKCFATRHRMHARGRIKYWLQKLVNIASLIFSIISIVILCMETMPSFKQPAPVKGHASITRLTSNLENVFFIIETICVAWFTGEYVTGFVLSARKLDFVRDAYSVIDLLAVLPYFVQLAVDASAYDGDISRGRFGGFLSLLRTLRVVRVLKLAKHSAGLQILLRSLGDSVREVVLVFGCLLGCGLVCAVLVYHAECGNRENQIRSVPNGLWWAIITMTTVGYGDVVPLTPLGKLVGGACAILGALFLVLPATFVSANFSRYYPSNYNG